MKKISINYRHVIWFLLMVGSLMFTFFYFNYVNARFLETLVDLKNSLMYWFKEVFGIELKGELSVLEFSKTPLVLPFNIPTTWSDFKLLWVNYWKLFVSADNFQAYFGSVGNFLFYLVNIISIVTPIIVVIILIKHFIHPKQDNNYNEDSKPLKAFKKVENKVLIPCHKFIYDFFVFLINNDILVKLLLLIWFYNFNGFSIIIEMIAYYFYFVTSFKTITIYTQVVKLIFDLSNIINFFPFWVWCFFAFIGINILCKRKAYDRLNHMELMNRGYINERPIIIMLNGTMGTKKTTMITDISLSQEIMFRNKAFELILDCDLKFPNFPWINLENELKKAIDKHIVYNLATCKKWINKRRDYFYSYSFHVKPRNIFDYDFIKYDFILNDKLSLINIWDVLEDYVQLYFIYTIESSLIISNYSIRIDNMLDSKGNLPLWNNDFFTTDPKLSEAYSRHSHILDFDMLRLGKKMLENNLYKDAFEFGVVVITEIGKERQNSIELKEIKKISVEVNQKNDLFNTELKMIRHSATVCNYPFVRFLCDDQRPESWGADARDLCEIVFIDEASKLLNCRPFFPLYNFFIDMILKRFENNYTKYRYKHGSNKLWMYLYHNLASKLYFWQMNNKNTFGYFELKTSIESGRMDGDKKSGYYFLSTKKIYSKRFSTDCFSNFFKEKALRSGVGINDIREFKGIKASFDEMLSENSYFFNDLDEIKNK